MDNAIFPNKFKAALAAHQVQIGCWCALANPISTEVLGLAGFDWLVLDAEHAPNDVTTLIPQLMALKGSSSAQVVRVPTNEPIIIKRMLDIGFYNFLVQIESQTGVDNVEAIAATEGVDGVFVGPSDLAAALGHLGNAAHPEVQRAIQHIFASAKKHGKPSGILAPVEADARRYLEWGATFVAVGSDLGVFRSATQKLADAFKK